MRTQIRTWVLRAALVAVTFVLPGNNASATTITFDGLPAGVFDSPYFEAGFRVTPLDGPWAKAPVGSPTPSVRTNGGAGALQVESLTPFTFNSFDFASLGGVTGYQIWGYVDGSTVPPASYFQSGVLTAGSTFTKIFSSDQTTLFKGIELRFLSGPGNTTPSTGYAIDNIAATSVPEPAALTLLGTGFAAVFATSRKRRMRA